MFSKSKLMKTSSYIGGILIALGLSPSLKAEDWGRYCPPGTTFVKVGQTCPVKDDGSGRTCRTYVFCKAAGGHLSGFGIGGSGSSGGSGLGGSVGAGSGESSDANENTGESQCSGETNPIDLATQNKVQTEVDYRGHGTLPLMLTRTYNSASRFSGVFGHQWSSNLFPQLSWKDYSTSGVDYREVKLYRYDGKLLTLKYDSEDNVWRRPSGQTEQLIALGEGSFAYFNNGLEEIYYPSGRIMAVKHANGEQLQYVYSLANGYGELTEIRHNSGQALKFQYTQGRLAQVEAPGNAIYRYAYNSSGNLTSVTYPALNNEVHQKQYVYEGTRLTKIIDENGDAYGHWQYDSYGRAIASAHGNQQNAVSIISSGTESGGRYTRTRNALGKETTYHFAKLGGQWKIKQVEGHAKDSCLAANQNTTYDANGFVDTQTNWAGHVTDYDHNAYGYVNKIIEAKGTAEQRTTEYQWNMMLNQPLSIQTDNLKTTFSYTDEGLLSQKTETALDSQISRSWSYQYTQHANGLTKTMTIDGPRTDVNDVSTYHYSTQGFLTQVINPLGHTTRYENYNANGQPQTIRYADGRVDTLSYHPRGWLLSKQADVYGDKRTTSYQYDKVGQLTQIIKPDGLRLSFTYDSAHRLTSVKNTENQSVEYAYDAASNLTHERIKHWVTKFEVCDGGSGGFGGFNPFAGKLGGELCPVLTHETIKEERRGYDALNRLTQIVRGIGEDSTSFGGGSGSTSGSVVKSVAYNTNNQPTTIKDAKGIPTTRSYDALGRIKTEVSRDGGVTTYGYDTNDRITSVNDPEGNTTRYAYDGFGQLIQQTSPDTGITRFQYDAAGNLTQKTDARNVISIMTYDALGRITSEAMGSSISRSYQYDKQRVGYLNRVVDESGTHNFEFNAHGEKTWQSSSLNGHSLITRWEYNKAGKISRIVYPSGSDIRYQFDSQGRVNGVTYNGQSVVHSVNYKPFGPVSDLKYGSNLLRLYSRDNQYRVTRLFSAGVMNLSYQYDKNSNIQSITDGYHSGQTSSRLYSYDVMDRLLTSNDYGTYHSYRYDKNGNRTYKDGTRYVTSNYTNRLQSVDSIAFSYDGNGNILSKGSQSYSYGDSNRMMSYQQGFTNASYDYNAFGQRVKKQVGHINTFFSYGTDGKLLHEYVDLNHKSLPDDKKDYVYLNSEPVAYIKNGTLHYIQSDHLGRPEVITNTSNTTVWRAENQAFDRKVITSSIGEFNLGFPGQYYDAEKASWYNYFRDYDADLGRYLQSDPIGLAAGQPSTYAYVDGNPVKRYDFLGLACVCIFDKSTMKDDKYIDRWYGQDRVVTATYTCKNTESKNSQKSIKGTHKEWYLHDRDGDDGREGNPIGTTYHPNARYNTYSGTWTYNQSGYEWFEAADSSSEELQSWASSCGC
ncbi:RHS repeat-associated core domain-containing protein [Pleionea sp. CnH1-48]|uniref:RHS repeat-associated core domain-containing protein n=1 Tax=Pleionea sp. CnH1-48 TaxID=2954494 RepID=UPI002096D21D|nr:RHS repeat-associated core domain-containing protein [Pleionea sp. CnH1-48]MCO7226589.1 DUF6531 domain-containing protein [Pleionea sp. CnH1-48]